MYWDLNFGRYHHVDESSSHHYDGGCHVVTAGGHFFGSQSDPNYFMPYRVIQPQSFYSKLKDCLLRDIWCIVDRLRGVHGVKRGVVGWDNFVSRTDDKFLNPVPIIPCHQERSKLNLCAQKLPIESFETSVVLSVNSDEFMASNDVSLDGIILCRDGSFFVIDRKCAFLAVRANHKPSKPPLSSPTTKSIDEFNWSMRSVPWHVLMALLIFCCINCHGGTPAKSMAKLIETPFWTSTMLCIYINNNNQHECFLGCLLE